MSIAGVWRSIECFRLDQTVVATKLLQQARGQLSAKRVRRCTLQLQKRLQKLCVSIRDGGSDIAHFLRAVGHTVRLCKEWDNYWTATTKLMSFSRPSCGFRTELYCRTHLIYVIKCLCTNDFSRPSFSYWTILLYDAFKSAFLKIYSSLFTVNGSKQI